VVGGHSAVIVLTLDALGLVGGPAERPKGEPMPERRVAGEPTPPTTDRPLRQVVVYLGITYAITLAIALALPHAGIAPLISIAVPVIAVALTTAVVVPRGQRRAVWGAVGFHPRGGRGLLVAVLGPAMDQPTRVEDWGKVSDRL
jgi:hypothetical protein